MKKYLILLVLTASSMALIFFTGEAPSNPEIVVETVDVVNKNLINSVVCNGIVREKSRDEIIVTKSAIVDEVFVEEGEFVKKGDALFTITAYELKTDDLHLISSAILSKNVGEYASDGISQTLEGSFYTKSEKKTVSYEPDDEKMTVYAHIDGVIESADISAGSVCVPHIRCMTLCDMSEMYAYVAVPERYISSVKEGQTSQLSGDAFSDATYTGKVSKIMPVAKSKGSLLEKSETFVECIINIGGYDGRLRPGYTVSAKIVTDRRESVPVIGYESIMQDLENHEYVYVLNEGRLYKHYIATGFELNAFTEVTYGLEAGDSVVINPDDSMYAGMYAKSGE